jgi:small conductance mechanosensitive channel
MPSLTRPIMLDLQAILDRILAMFDLKPAVMRQVALKLVVTWLLAWIGWQLVKLVARRVVAVADDHHADTASFREKRAATIAQLLRSAGWGVLMILTIILTLKQFIDIGPVLGATAVLGLAVSFGAQSLVKDYFAGFFILLENQFVVGDSIEAAGQSGVVEHLTLRAVTLRDIEGTVHIIPNGQITTLSNKTRGWSRAVIDVGVGYDNDIDAVIAVLRQEADAFGKDAAWSGKFDSTPDVLGVESFGDTGVTIRVLLRTKPGMQGEVAREFRRRVVIRLEREGIKGARSQQTINIHPAHDASRPSVEVVTGEPAVAGNAANPPPRAPDPNASPIPGAT